MKVLVTGSSGLIGSAVVDALTAKGCEVERLRREPASAAPPYWNPEQGVVNLGEAPAIDAVIHLAGESIATGRWTAAKKARIRESRVRGTQLLAESLARLRRRPTVLISGSAVGIYGRRGDEELEETSPPGQGFLAEVCQQWEAATRPASDAGIRVVTIRLGVVLSPAGGTLKALRTPFKMGVGGRIGSGAQYMSWVSMRDVTEMIHYVMTSDAITGPVNLVSPHPVTNSQFTKALGRVWRRPTFCALPAAMARLAFGEMGDELLLASTRVRPRKLLAAGYPFRHPDLEEALRDLLR